MLSGARRGEVCALRWVDVDSTRAILWVPASISQTKAGLSRKATKSEKGRWVSLDPYTLTLLAEHRTRNENVRAALAATCADDVVYRDRFGHATGRDDLDGHVAAAQIHLPARLERDGDRSRCVAEDCLVGDLGVALHQEREGARHAAVGDEIGNHGDGRVGVLVDRTVEDLAVGERHVGAARHDLQPGGLGLRYLVRIRAGDVDVAKVVAEAAALAEQREGLVGAAEMIDQLLETLGNEIGKFFDSPLVRLSLQAIAFYVVLLWAATAYWAYRDLQTRTSNPVAPYLAAALIILSWRTAPTSSARRAWARHCAASPR